MKLKEAKFVGNFSQHLGHTGNYFVVIVLEDKGLQKAWDEFLLYFIAINVFKNL